MLDAELTMPEDQAAVPAIDKLAGMLQHEVSELDIKNVDGGHMAYGRWLITTTQDNHHYFAKGHRPELFTDPIRERHARQYLEKEQAMFDYLRQSGYTHIPDFSQLIDGSLLVMDALSPDQNWTWRAEDSTDVDHYIESVLASLEALQAVPIAPQVNFFPKRIMKVYMDEGWDYLTPEHISEIQQRISNWSQDFHTETDEWAEKLKPRIQTYVNPGRALYNQAQPLYLSHHDARQANIAHNPEHGAHLIDWSWADVGFKNADSTMFLIDLTKSEVDVTLYLEDHFNPEHALLLMGHWLGRSIEPTRDGDTTVRFHQLTSAITAYKLLCQTNYLKS